MGDKSEIPQSAARPFRKRKGVIEFLLVTSLDTQRWVLPKGHIDDGMTPRKAAELEAYEEAGLKGNISKTSIGSYVYVKSEYKGGGTRRVEVFPMEVTQVCRRYPERNARRRSWMKVDKAVAVVAERKLKKMLQRFGKDLAND